MFFPLFPEFTVSRAVRVTVGELGEAQFIDPMPHQFPQLSLPRFVFEQYSEGFGHPVETHPPPPVFCALQLVPEQLQLQGPLPETPLEEPALQSSLGVEGAEDNVAPLADPQTPGWRVALQAARLLAPGQFHVQPVQ